jgi:drug/metabolite transporter (DMT)-like permease
MLPAFLTTVLFAISAVSANRTARLLGGIRANFWRITLAAFLLGLWAHTLGSGISGQAFPFFVLSGCVGFGVGDLAYYQSLPRLGSRLSVMLVHCLAAPFAALIEWVWLGTTLTGMEMVSSLTILVGVAMALTPDRQLNLGKGLLLSGVLFGSLAAGAQGFGAVLSRKAYQVAGLAGEPIDGLTAAYQRILAGWVVAAISFLIARSLTGRSTPLRSELGSPRGPGQSALGWVVVNALAGPTLGVGCYQWALATEPTGVVMPIVATTPIAVMPLARFLEREKPSSRSLLGGVIAVLGAVALALAK